MSAHSNAYARFGALSDSRITPAWWVAVLLALPAFIPLLQSVVVAWSTGMLPTGFVHTDQPYYVANARESFDQGFGLFYGNPYGGYDTPKIYFQPHLFLIGAVQQLGLDPGLVWVCFSIVGTLFAAYVAVRLYVDIVGWRSPAAKLGLLCFFWGGGILTLVGFAYAGAIGKLDIATVLHFDPGPARGWWMLNFGRNLIYGPTEAYYHALFLLSILLLIRQWFAWAIVVAAILTASHPITGIESSLTVTGFLAMERLLGNRSIKPAHIAAAFAVFCAHVWYYLIFLNQFPDHTALQAMWEHQGIDRGWLYPVSTFVPVLFIVGCFAAARLWRWPGLRSVLQEPRDRLFLLWFLITFGLSHHDWFMRPIQPIHFARGYDWIALFFLGAPVLIELLDRLSHIEIVPLRTVAVVAFVTFFLSDNLFWFATFLRPGMAQAILITPNQKDVLNWLNRTATPPDMVVTADPLLGYLVSTYSRVRSWAGYGGGTLDFARKVSESRQAFQSETILPEWTQMPVLYVQRKPQDAAWQPPANAREVYQNAAFCIWEATPDRAP